jgi:hypothetical protein
LVVTLGSIYSEPRSVLIVCGASPGILKLDDEARSLLSVRPHDAAHPLDHPPKLPAPAGHDHNRGHRAIETFVGEAGGD